MDGDGSGRSTSPGEHALLSAVCSAAESLLARAPAPPSRLRVRCGEVSVDLAWSAGQQGQSRSAGPDAVADSERQPVEAPPVSYIRAPMVGTFYHAPAPGAPPFVKVGDLVEPGQQVGILEAMKLMNPVEAEAGGQVREVLVADATGVEFDQRLIAVVGPEPAS